MPQLNTIQFFSEIEDSRNVLIAGVGGGFDIYCSIPLYFSLKAMGKNVRLANFSFTLLEETTS